MTGPALGGVWFLHATMDVPAAVPTAQVAARRSGPRRVAIAAAVVLAVTIVRPWDAAGGPTPVEPGGLAGAAAAVRLPDAADLAGSSVAAAPRASSSPEPSLLPDEIACNPGGWTIVSLDRLGSWTVRSWVPAHAVRADGPLDPRIARLTLESPEVLAIGACTPAIVDPTGAEVPGGRAQVAAAWRIEGDHATRIDPGVWRPEERATVATLYRPRGGAVGGSPAAWPGGDYVVELRLDQPIDGAAAGWFLGFEVRGTG